MSDCANVEMRELLPELIAGTLGAATRARVEAHVRGCEECASEAETLRLVRAAFADPPVIDASRVSAALPKPSVQPPRRVTASPRGHRWMDWRVAAALTMITVGGLSVAVTQRMQTTRRAPVVDSSSTSPLGPVTVPPDVTSPAAPKGTDSGLAVPNAGAPNTTARVAQVELKFGGSGEGELDDASLRALLGALDEIDRGPVAPSAEPDGSPVLPVIREGGR